MNFPLYLAMTAQEMTNSSAPPRYSAFLGCCFSQSGSGLSGLPRELPKGCMLILDDRNPFRDHDPCRIGDELNRVIREMECDSLLLDFQRTGCPEAGTLARYLSDSLPCPVAVSHHYADFCPGPLFLPPVPPDCSLGTYLAPWKGKEIWLEFSFSRLCLTLTESGCTADDDRMPQEQAGLPCPALLSRYHVEISSGAARFYFWRTRQDLDALAEQAHAQGVTRAVGLWQELG